MTHMQRELESLRASEKALRTKLRDMELDNDDLEKSERCVRPPSRRTRAGWLTCRACQQGEGLVAAGL